MAIRIRDTSTREDVKLAIQNAVRQQVQTFDALSNVEHELGFGLINLDSIVSTAASDADGECELSEEDFRNILRELERE
jgi:translation elongation factor EF-1beta